VLAQRRFLQLPDTPLKKFTGLGAIYALLTAAAWGIVSGMIHAHFWFVLVGGVTTAAMGLWLERDALKPVNASRTTYYLQIAAAYVFLAIIGVGLVSLAYFLGEWILAKISHR
jgi:hypothetical protein